MLRQSVLLQTPFTWTFCSCDTKGRLSQHCDSTRWDVCVKHEGTLMFYKSWLTRYKISVYSSIREHYSISQQLCTMYFLSILFLHFLVDILNQLTFGSNLSIFLYGNVQRTFKVNKRIKFYHNFGLEFL